MYQIRSDHISRSVVSDSLRPHESQHARPPCPSPTPRVHSDSRPSSRWCHPAIASSVVPFSSCPQSLPASESFHNFNQFLSFFFWPGGILFGALPSLLMHKVTCITNLQVCISTECDVKGIRCPHSNQSGQCSNSQFSCILYYCSKLQ